jgi:argininosuccinate lyase
MLYRRWIGGSGELVSRYTSSIVDDAEIGDAVIQVMRAHVKHLGELGLIPRDAEEALLDALATVKPSDLLGGGYEDIHEALEDYLIRKLGELGGWVGLGRSRNDHVAAAVRLRLLDRLDSLGDGIRKLRRTLLRLSIQYSRCIMPGFTHSQPAQPITLGHYFLAMDEALMEFQQLLKPARSIVDKSPLGSGALGGTTVPLDRARLGRHAGFTGVVENTLYATGSRFFANVASSLVVSMLLELGRFVEDLVNWSSPMVGYVVPHEEHVSTSSIMPHKRNPVTLEVFRARVGEALGHLVSLLSIQRNLGTGYSLDLQEATRHLWAIVNIGVEGVGVLRSFLEGAHYDCARMREDASKYPITSSDLAESISMGGVPYREAYFEVAKGLGELELPSPEDSVGSKRVLGGPNPEEVVRIAQERLRSIEDYA